MAANGTTHSEQNGESKVSTPSVIPLQINGQDVQSDVTFDVINPSTGEVIWKCSSVSKDNAIKAVEAAQAAFPKWSKTKQDERRDIMLRAADIMKRRHDELFKYCAEETATPPLMITKINIENAVALIKDTAGRISTIQGIVPECADVGTSAIVFKEPYGVVLGIAPWNAPYILGVRAVAAAIAAGNTCVLKASELSPMCYWAIGDVFREAGLPDGVLNVIAHRPQDAAEVTTALIEHPAVKKINFTGSTLVGGIIASTAGKNLKPVVMELGGKASTIILADADLKKAALACTIAAFFHSGQICMSTERIVVHSSVAEAFKAELKGTIDAVFSPQGDSTVLINPVGVKKNRRLVSQAVEKGAKILHGDVDSKESTETRLRPIVVGGVTKDMDLYYTESFGPTVSFIEVGSEEEAIALANDTDYGLSAAIFTESLQTGLRVAKQIESGAVHINSMTVHDEPALPHGGVKKSGFGRFNSSTGLDEWLKTKTVTWQD